MKKITSKLLLLMMVLVMTFAITACGNGKDDQKSDITSETSQTPTGDDNNDTTSGTSPTPAVDDNNDTTSGTSPTPAVDDNDDATSGTDQAPTTDNDDSKESAAYDTVSDYINTDEAKEVFNNLEKMVEGSGMSMKISAEDNKLIYTYSYDEIEKTDEKTKQLEEYIASLDATFQMTANAMKEYVNSDEVIVVIEYLDCNGEEIFSKEYISE